MDQVELFYQSTVHKQIPDASLSCYCYKEILEHIKLCGKNDQYLIGLFVLGWNKWKNVRVCKYMVDIRYKYSC